MKSLIFTHAGLSFDFFLSLSFLIKKEKIDRSPKRGRFKHGVFQRERYHFIFNLDWGFPTFYNLQVGNFSHFQQKKPNEMVL